jgi:hypothetical protein
VNATTLLKRDHDRVRSLFQRMRNGTIGDRRRETLREIATELVLHSQLEEEFFYPAIDACADREGAQLVADATSAHADIDDRIERLLAMDVRGREFGRAVTELERSVQGHVRDEEARLFPVAERLLGAGRLDEIGRAIQARRARLAAA